METPKKRHVTCSVDPVHQHNGLWWFYDEIWSGRLGPFESRILAEMALRDYCLKLTGRAYRAK